MSDIDRNTQPWQALYGWTRARLSSAGWIQGAVAALVVGMVQVALAVSFAALVFSRDLAPFLGDGVGFALYGAAAAGIVVALTASLPGTVGNAKGVVAALVAVLAAGIVGAMPGRAPEAWFATVMAAIVLTGLATGILLLLLGRFRLGRLVRFLPYPVIGGFVAGTGWLLTASSLELLAGAPLSVGTLSSWLEPAALVEWGLGLAVAVVLLVATWRFQHPLVLPSLVASMFLAFTAWVAISPVSLADLQAAGRLLGPFADGVHWRPAEIGPLALIDWGAILMQAPTIGVIFLIAAMEVLLNATGMEIELGRDVDLDQELRSAGMATLATGAGGGLPGYQVLSLSLLNARLGGNARWAAAGTSSVAIVALAAGGGFVELLPTFILGGLMAYVGLRLGKTWVVEAWSYLPRVEYVLVLVILLSIATAGILVGVAVGTVAAILLFALAYGRIDVVRHELTADETGSRVSWSPEDQRLIAARAGQVRIFQLQGYLFFGTAYRLFRRAERLLSARDTRVRFLVLDFRRVTGLDATGAFTLLKLQQAAVRRDVTLVFTHLAPNVEGRLRSVGALHPESVRVTSDLDRGLEWCERCLLADARAEATETETHPNHASGGWNELASSAVEHRFARRELATGEVLIAQGDVANAFYVVESGSLTAWLHAPGADPLRLETVGAGRVLGELGFFLGRDRSATVVADEPSVVLCLSRQELDRLEEEDPAAATELYQTLTRLLSQRVVHLMQVVGALER